MVTFRIGFGQGMMCNGEPVAGELVFYRSLRPVAAFKSGMYLAAPGSEEEYLRVPVHNVEGKPVSDVIKLETSSRREVQSWSDGEDEKPSAVYSCVHVQGKHEQYLFNGWRVPEMLSEQTSYSALLMANQQPKDRRISIAEAEKLTGV